MYDVWIFNILLRLPLHVGLWWCRVIHSTSVRLVLWVWVQSICSSSRHIFMLLSVHL